MAKKQGIVYLIDDDKSVREAIGRLLRSAHLDPELLLPPRIYCAIHLE